MILESSYMFLFSRCLANLLQQAMDSIQRPVLKLLWTSQEPDLHVAELRKATQEQWPGAEEKTSSFAGL